MAFDFNRLYSQLNITGLQNSNPPLYQLLKLMIGAIAEIAVTASSSSSSSSSTVTINETIQQIVGSLSAISLSEDDNSNVMIPGPIGLTGPAGPQGIPGLDGIDGEEHFFLIGP